MGNRDVKTVRPPMEIVKVGIIEDRRILFPRLDKIPLGLIQKGISRNIRTTESHTEEATVLWTMEPLEFIPKVAVLTVVGELERGELERG
jgi:hypothetical protein